MPNILYLDAETRKWSTEVENAFDNIPAFELSLLCTFDTVSNTYKTWMQHNISGLELLLADMDLVIGFNTKRFDYILLQQYMPNTNLETLPSFDLLEEVEIILKRRLSLNNLAKETLKVEKSGDGKEAVEWWKNSELSKLEHYCRRDVAITRNLFQYACKEKYLKYIDPNSQEGRILNTSQWINKAKNIIDLHIPF